MRNKLAAFAETTGADEIMINTAIHDHAARKRSYAITADAWSIPTAVA